MSASFEHAAVPDSVESALADFGLAARQRAVHPSTEADRAYRETLGSVRVLVAAAISQAREEGGRIALGWPAAGED